MNLNSNIVLARVLMTESVVEYLCEINNPDWSCVTASVVILFLLMFSSLFLFQP